MVRHLLLFISTCLLSRFAAAQDVPAFMIGPTVGIDQMSYVNVGQLVGGPSGDSPTSINVGVDGSYQTGQWLFGSKLLYTKRVYQEQPSASFLIDPSFSPYRPLRTDTELHVLTIPFSVGYQLAASPKFYWYAGGTVAVDYLAGTGNQVVLSSLGTSINPTPDRQSFGRSINIGYGIQTTFRYLLTSRLGLQLEPALRRYPRGGFPTSIYNNFQFQGQFAILFSL